jgi:hypothetical protein
MGSIRRTELTDGTLISTVKIDPIPKLLDVMLDPLLGRESAPYETMVFLDDEYPKECRLERYQTEREAILGHTRIVEEEMRARGLERAPQDTNLNEDDDAAKTRH